MDVAAVFHYLHSDANENFARFGNVWRLNLRQIVLQMFPFTLRGRVLVKRKI